MTVQPEFPAAALCDTTDAVPQPRALCVAHVRVRQQDGTLVSADAISSTGTECEDCRERKPQVVTDA